MLIVDTASSSFVRSFRRSFAHFFDGKPTEIVANCAITETPPPPRPEMAQGPHNHLRIFRERQRCMAEEKLVFLPVDETIAFRVASLIASGSDGRAGG